MKVEFDEYFNLVIKAENKTEQFALNHFADEDDKWKNKIYIQWGEVVSSTEDTKEFVSSKTQNTVHNDWLPWNGGECPVDGDTVVEVERLNGALDKAKAGYLLGWNNGSNGRYIIRYRVVGGEK